MLRLSRLLLSVIFIVGGAGAARSPEGRHLAVERLPVTVPLDPHLAVRLNGAGMVVLGTTMALGIAPRLSALGLAGLLVPTTLGGHPFWTMPEGPERKAQQIQAAKNVSLLGGLLAVACTPERRAPRARA